MNTVNLLILDAVQGLTEFLPVSSSGHLALFQEFLGMESPEGATLEVLLHGGTLISVLVFYREKLLSLCQGLIKRDKGSLLYCAALLLSCLPAMVVYVLAGKAIEKSFTSVFLIAGCLIVTGAILLSQQFLPSSLPFRSQPMTWWRALLTGAAQAVAMLPGISRSGSTITAARWLGLGGAEAMEFSFLMSIPILGGGIILKIGEACHDGLGGLNPLSVILAAAVAAVIGYLALKLLKLLQLLGRLQYFGYYCLGIGVLAIVLKLSLR